MKRATFTTENRAKTRDRLKTQTRRISDWNVQSGEIMILSEPTQVLDIVNHQNQSLKYAEPNFNYNHFADVYYPDSDCRHRIQVSTISTKKLLNRKDWSKKAIARFMLNDFARHYIRILNVHEEMLQDISVQDAIAEGCKASNDREDDTVITAIDRFHDLWDSINKDEGRRWKDNPRVHVYGYEFLDALPEDYKQPEKQADRELAPF